MADAYLQLPLSFDTCSLSQDVNKLLAKFWPQHINTRAHNGGWKALPLRSVGGNVEEIAVADLDLASYEDTEYLRSSAHLTAALASLKCPLYSARLMCLTAGEEIKYHTDHCLSFEDKCARLHIPIQTNSKVIFTINDENVHFSEGGCWYMNANYPHRVINGSGSDRIHLVVDCEVNAWLEKLFDQAGYKGAPAPSIYGDSNITDDNVLLIAEQLARSGTETGKALAKSLRDAYKLRNIN